jgi:hypothetical protein
MPWVGFKPTITASERAKTGNVLDRWLEWSACTNLNKQTFPSQHVHALSGIRTNGSGVCASEATSCRRQLAYRDRPCRDMGSINDGHSLLIAVIPLTHWSALIHQSFTYTRNQKYGHLSLGDRAGELTGFPLPVHCSPKVWFRCSENEVVSHRAWTKCMCRRWQRGRGTGKSLIRNIMAHCTC